MSLLAIVLAASIGATGEARTFATLEIIEPIETRSLGSDVVYDPIGNTNATNNNFQIQLEKRDIQQSPLRQVALVTIVLQ